MADLVVVPGRDNCQHFAAYPMVQVAMSRWGRHAAGTWLVSIFVDRNFEITDSLAVIDDFGNLVEVQRG